MATKAGQIMCRRHCVALFVLISVSISVVQVTESCQGRKLLSGTVGYISDGDGKYKESMHCEWLIDGGGPSAQQFISLDILSMGTECSYDYLFVYDGKSFNSPLLGSFSGRPRTMPNTIVAKSGYMLIYFFSDRNYALEGFNSSYVISDCPMSCSGHGRCNEHHDCECDSGYRGEGCEHENCPNNCGMDQGHGHCSSHCVCNANYTGSDCGLEMYSNEGANVWYKISPDGSEFESRMGHAGMYIQRWNSLFIFGGYTLNTILDDLIKFDFGTNRWEKITRKGINWPKGRHGHTMIKFNDNLYIFGGVLSDGVQSNELWVFSTEHGMWTQLAVGSKLKPKPVASHTMTLADDGWLYIIGGRASNGHFLSDIYRIQLPAASEWEKVDVRGGKITDRRLVGHSAVYHKESRSIIVLGGFVPDYARFPKRTNNLHAFHIDHRYWSHLYHCDSSLSDQGTCEHAPKNLAFHTSVIMGNYMVVFGGNMHHHHNEEICYADGIHFYHLGCHQWVDHEQLMAVFPGTKVKIHQNTSVGRFSHVMDVAFGNTLLIVGGYRGHAAGDLIAFKVPPNIAKYQGDPTYAPIGNHCPEYPNYDGCKLDPECVWCMDRPDSGTPGCIHRTKAKDCNGDVRPGTCPEICSLLLDCGSCLVQGSGADTSISDLPGLWHNQPCAWCVKEAMCSVRSELPRTCNSSTATDSRVVGWWGGLSKYLMDVDQCITQDMPSGLHWITYRNPPNPSHPDEVEIIRNTQKKFQFVEDVVKELKLGGNLTVVMRGFIHPLEVSFSHSKDEPKVYLVSNSCRAQLYLSTDTTVANKELVAELESPSFVEKTAERKNKSALFPRRERGYKYYIEEKAWQTVSGTNQLCKIHTEWSVALRDPNRIRQVLTHEFLEPYNNGDCSTLTNCMACMTDIQCGWCQSIKQCVKRDAISSQAPECDGLQGRPFSIVEATECPVCADYIDCFTCSQDNLCEWLVEEARCFRRGRFPAAVTNSSRCPEMCHLRTSCSGCISDGSECAWCEESQTCFPFLEYVLRYAYGGCMKWVDRQSVALHLCHNCSRHATSKKCLQELQCGWCGNVADPTIGVCVSGDFTGPSTTETCTSIVMGQHNVSQTEPTDWFYGVFPDVEECLLGYHDCHENATCINTFGSYICTCNRGFMGNGVDNCDRTCYYDCVYGECSGSPEHVCKCSVGWTALDCNTNCGCNNHSTCSGGVGVCDHCQHWTMGDSCEMCRPGSYGNATTELGCTPCECNEHADKDAGYCHVKTGKCYCKDNTVGNRCDRCLDGYYGDPREGGTCYLKCEGRTVLQNISSGALGSYEGEGIQYGYAHCLWILTVFPDVTTIKSKKQTENAPIISFTVEKDIKTECDKEYVYIYDGVPEFLITPSSARLLAALCGYGLENPVTVQARSGTLTVIYQDIFDPHAEPGTIGFNATYRIDSCWLGCWEHEVCEEGRCVCAPGWAGVRCLKQACPNNCSFSRSQGICNMTMRVCVCYEGYHGPDCSTTLHNNNTLKVETLLDPWVSLGSQAFNLSVSRMGHTLVSCGKDELYMFGGYSLYRGMLNDMWTYNTKTHRWKELRPNSVHVPDPRYFHGAVCIPSLHAIYIFGGLVQGNGKFGAVEEMWKYSIDSGRWTEINVTTQEGLVPPLAGHTMTLIGNSDNKVWIIGGLSSDFYYAESSYEYDAGTNIWRTLPLDGTVSIGLYGHTAIYHEEIDAVYVYGGYEYQTDTNRPSHNLYAIDVQKNKWNLQKPNRKFDTPTARYFHNGINMGDYMMVFGGKTLWGYDQSIFVYHYKCNMWINLTPHVKALYRDFPPKLMGQAAVVLDKLVYIMGGFDGLIHATMRRLYMPEDLCTLFNSLESCKRYSGCAACLAEGSHHVYCYSATRPTPHQCIANNGTVVHTPNTDECTLESLESQNCSIYEFCQECLSEWPAHRGHKQKCQWCSNCQTGKCIPKNVDCQTYHSCNLTQRPIKDVNECVERVCQAADCDVCLMNRHNKCMWTRNFRRLTEVGRSLSFSPIYSWNCVAMSLLAASKKPIQSSPPDQCPVRCYQYPTCDDCLSSHGSEGGDQQCVWSPRLQECMPPAYLPLRCSSGDCGLIVRRQEPIPKLHCHHPCKQHTKCSSCLSQPGCGWCSLGGLNGLGVCMEGGLKGPFVGLMCSASNISLGTEPLPGNTGNWTRYATGPPHWAYVGCPAEDECTNGHHTCSKTEKCVDLLVDFKCVCKDGYKWDQSAEKCNPVCHQGCEPHGTCVMPDRCQCHFGWVGHNCSTECECNKHSNCKSVLEKDVCLQCMNNTVGKQCGYCKQWFVGNPRKGIACKPCSEFCNRHSGICINQENPRKWRNSDVGYWQIGPESESDTVCNNCANNTQGNRCSECMDGYFRRGDDLTKPCTPCQCNGHSYICDKDSGINCNCKNNTNSDCREKEKTDGKHCFETQCSKCQESFMGTPTDGHQCYRHMSVDREYCFDPTTQMDCMREPQPLLHHRTVFFGVRPKYVNVDIRIVIDVTKGGVDLYFARKEDEFIVTVDKHTGIHTVELDKEHNGIISDVDGSSTTLSSRMKRDIISVDSNTEYVPNFPLRYQYKASGLTTFIKVLDKNALLLVRDIRHRLVITLPFEIHELKDTMFFMVLRGRGSADDDKTYGGLFFRQDQPHIDLFVFFSVFFSCFFLFLALCVLMWKIKQAVDARQSRHRRLREMEHMASRPFARSIIIFDSGNPLDGSPLLPRKSTFPKPNSKYSICSDSYHNHLPADHFCLNPLAIEPTDDGVAAVGTFLFQMPGASEGPIKACLGSTLLTMRVVYPCTAHYHVPKVMIRRRPSISV